MKPKRFALFHSSLFLFSLLPCGFLSAGDREARTVHYSKKDIIELRCQVRVSTAIVLPTNEKILDFTTGDKEYWIVNGAENFCYVHPAKPRDNLLGNGVDRGARWPWARSWSWWS